MTKPTSTNEFKDTNNAVDTTSVIDPNTNARTHTVDVVIIGAGISGSILGCILARHGQKVAICEAGVHPKFSIGESMILETSEIFRSLAKVYDVPELEYYSSENFFPKISTSHGVKRHFSYIHHTRNQTQNPDHVIQAVIPQAPYGHEIHIHRQDSDYFLASTAVKYGAKLFQNTKVETIDINDSGVIVKTANDVLNAKYIVDAGGFRSILADQNKLRTKDLKTHARGIFTHMINVPSVHETSNPQSKYGIPYALEEGTLHHIFDGGWMWIIPFDNHAESTNPLCSVGLMLDPRKYPEDTSLSPEEEFWDFTKKFPSMYAQLQNAKSVRPWVRGGRIQYSSKEAHGSRYSLLGHAAGFIDPLFSKGLYTSMASIMGLAKALINAKKTGNYTQEQFKDCADTTLRYVQNNDRLISNAYKSFQDPRLWHQYSVLWILGAYLELVKLTTYRYQLERKTNSFEESLNFPFPELSLVGGGYEPYFDLADKMDQSLNSLGAGAEADIKRVTLEMQNHLNEADWIPYSFREIANGKKHLPNRKFTHRLLLNKGGIMGEPEFRKHFYEDLTLFDLARKMFSEKLKYSRNAIRKHGSN
ncbi:NAD(P)/FAD-dependent oxidoreductase [Kordiimonas sp. SCSIO 12610]|uniref:NAD(P)/FAD-dependent oxidoreductase n=1 Tax=Kordiimonas sp. SCSIO 12610 TaxID=2829597 RepID=UPI0021094091|nr:NAD(P)/FAD-dependent oxidoreductase [Kordiimonas sp. SCSIO 12610]UTW54915.1 NAD(P)/FAD-dependent oxidoreductase [Kordiimonas sp. SCSIO 12610]